MDHAHARPLLIDPEARGSRLPEDRRGSAKTLVESEAALETRRHDVDGGARPVAL